MPLQLWRLPYLKQYIGLCQPKARARAFDKTGWDGNCYILSEHKIYSPDDKNSQKKERLILNIEGYTPTFEQKGTLKEWQQTLGNYDQRTIRQTSD
jgi:uncharacterized protein (DUF927 family)